MVKSNCLIPSLEKVLVDSRELQMYIDTINMIDDPTDYTIQWLIGTNISFALSPNLLRALIEHKQEDKYLVGKVLSEKTFEFPYPNVSIETVVEQYRITSPIWSTIKNNINLVYYIIHNNYYNNLKEEEYPTVLKSLYNGKQTASFVEFLFDNVSNGEKLYYLDNMGEILDAENSIAIANYLSDDNNIVLLQDKNLFFKVRERLWEEVPKNSGYKGVFTRRRNQKFPSDKA